MSGKNDLFDAISFVGDESDAIDTAAVAGGGGELLEIDLADPGKPGADIIAKPNDDDEDIKNDLDKNKDKKETDNLIEIEDDTQKDKDTLGDDQRSSPFSSLAKAFISRGHLTESDEIMAELNKAKTMEEFMDIYETNRNDINTGSLNDNQKKYLEGLKAGVPLEKFQEYAKAVVSLKNVTDENITNSDKVTEQVINWYYSIKLGDAEEAKDFTAVAMTKDNKLDVAKKARTALLKYHQDAYDKEVAAGNTSQQAEVTAEKANLEEVKKRISGKELFPKTKLSEVMQEQVIEAATKIVADDTNGKPMTALMKEMRDNPIETNAKLAYIWVTTKGLTSLSGFNTKAMTEATQAVEELSRRGTQGSIYDPANPEATAQRMGKSKELTDIIRMALD